MGQYIAAEDVRLRLVGKVSFTEDEDTENTMSYTLLNRLVAEAEGAVEMDLSPRYMAPFQPDAGGLFKALPDTTKNYLRTLCELLAVIRVLETDFGRGTVADGDKYTEKIQKRYDAMVEKLLEKKKHGGEESGFKYPPLPGLRRNYMNTEADDGYMGQVLSTSDSNGDYPQHRINDPAESFWNTRIEELF